METNTNKYDKYITTYLKNQVNLLERKVEDLIVENEDLKTINGRLESKLERLENELLQQRWLDGRPVKLSIKQQRDVMKKRREGASIQKLATEYGCSVATIYKLVKDIDVDLRRKSTPTKPKNSRCH